jgi:hypothetical protein
MAVEQRTVRARARVATTALVALVIVLGLVSPAAAAGRPGAKPLVLRTVQAISRDTISAPGSEHDTEAEPAVAVDPGDAAHAVAVFQEGRFNTGGAVVNGFAATFDQGQTWTDGLLPDLTQATGGTWERASDPSVAIGLDGTAYAASLVINGAPFVTASGVLVSRSPDGGRTWDAPVVVHQDLTSGVLNDKPWIVVDSDPASPFVGRIYVAWDRPSVGIPILLSVSDDGGASWRGPTPVAHHFNGGALPVVHRGGDLSVFYDGSSSTGVSLVVRTSHDGGRSFDPPVTVAEMQSKDPAGMRAGSFTPSAAVDASTGTMYVTWQDTRFRGGLLNDPVVSMSVDGGATWSQAVAADPDPPSSPLDRFLPSVGADHGVVTVTYRSIDTVAGSSAPVLEQVVRSDDGGQTWIGGAMLGPPSDIRAAAVAGNLIFFGDYQATVVSGDVAYAVWCRSSLPPNAHPFHQRAWAAALILG